jgi:hypothetical protein
MDKQHDIRQITQVREIRHLLIKHPDLLSMFEILLIIVNNRLNDEPPEHIFDEVDKTLNDD